MANFIKFTVLLGLVNLTIGKEFTVGMFKKKDLLVAQDRIYKERTPFVMNYAKYGRKFNCKITYIRVTDRMGYTKGPTTEIIRGGLQKKYVVLRLRAYNLPIAANVYVGCSGEKIKKSLTTTRTKISTTSSAGSDKTSAVDTTTTAPLTTTTPFGPVTSSDATSTHAPSSDASSSDASITEKPPGEASSAVTSSSDASSSITEKPPGEASSAVTSSSAASSSSTEKPPA